MPRTHPQPRKAPASPRDRILAAATTLINQGGHDAVTTRAVSAMAEVQAPTIYRLFKDKEGLLSAVAERVFAAYAAEKSRSAPGKDAVEDLRLGWNAHVAFGFAHPAVFALIYATVPRSATAVEAGLAVLRGKVHRVALSGRLRGSEERAVNLLHAAGIGTVLALLPKPSESREDMVDAAREAIFDAILHDTALPEKAGVSAIAFTLGTSLDEMSYLSPGERLLLGELLDRIAKNG